jgi:hypothetical protein
MASNNPGDGLTSRTGRGFAVADPERQREVVGYVRTSPITTAPQSRFAAERAARTARARVDWMWIQADRDTSTFEGSSSRRGR